MRKLAIPVIALVGLSACDPARDVTAPPIEGPSLHVVPGGDPDGDYSMYFTDAEPGKTLALSVAQEWSEGSAECDPNDGTHADHSEDPTLEEALDDMKPAAGIGIFSFRNREGTLAVTHACWFNEWNGAGGFPESAWALGVAWVGGQNVPFAAKLISNGWPELTHIFELDAAEFYLHRGNGLKKLFTTTGELHHEDEATLIG